jgi:hypothetical protein
MHFFQLVSWLTKVVMVITLYVGWVKYRDLERSPLIRILYRDGTLYFILTFSEWTLWPLP